MNQASGEQQQSEEVIRLALVMNGGVSLAVWMGGVTHELTRLLGRDPKGPSQAWERVLTVPEDNDGRPRPRRRVAVDYAAGTSAGGLNGCLLATSLARGGALEGLKDL
jgi:predicted acylesterase/phospholipase RssA